MMANFLNRIFRVCSQYTGAIRSWPALCSPQTSISLCSVPSHNFNTVIQQESGNLWNKCRGSSLRILKASNTCSPQLPISSSVRHGSLGPAGTAFGRGHWRERRPVMEKVTLTDGKRTDVRMVPERFFRLNWGVWIRRIAGCHNKVWAKNTKRLKRARQHVMCNATQCKMLDKMVGPYWRNPKYYVDDPYAPYHVREDFLGTRRKPVDIPPRL